MQEIKQQELQKSEENNKTAAKEGIKELGKNGRKLEKLELMLRSRGMKAFEYYPDTDYLILYDEKLNIERKVPGYAEYLKTAKTVFPEDRWKILSFFQGKMEGPVEIRTFSKDGRVKRRMLDSILVEEEQGPVYVGCTRDITEEKEREEMLEAQARKDPLTHLYNHFWGKELINEYLERKNPYSSCGLLLIDIDYFKSVNDTYGHLFGDKALIQLADVLRAVFYSDDVAMRCGGDEFVVLLKDIDYASLVKKVMQLIRRVRAQKFEEESYSMTCSVGVCFLPENVSGYSYDQLFENADWALYQAKLNGRDRYEFCDNLKRFRFSAEDENMKDAHIDSRYMRNDIVSTAFEIFEKMNSFDAALELLLKVVGIRLRLDRITVIRTDLQEKQVGRQYQWVSDRAPEVLETGDSFTKEDFLTLFHSYDEYGTTVLQYDNMGMYSESGAALLMQGEAKTVLYAAMYCEGKYTGAISYVVCTDKRYWSKQSRSQLGELTKLISAHLAKNLAMNVSGQGVMASPDYDSLTGLLSFSRFREEVERIIVGGYGTSYIMVYSDFENFHLFNQKYGYNAGDWLLRDFANFLIDNHDPEKKIYLSRIVADQFVLFMPFEKIHDHESMRRITKEVNDEFARQQKQKHPECRLRIRTGIYPIEKECIGVSEAIDAANYARKQIKSGSSCTVEIFGEQLSWKRALDNEIANNMDRAIKERQFKVFLQPKISLKDGKLIGAEALVRWVRDDGTTLLPGSFIPQYEENGRIVDLDFYVLECVAELLAKNEKLDRRQVPISVNASSLHAADPETAKKYMKIIRKYNVNPSFVDVELLETAMVSDYDNVRKMFQDLRNAGIRTSLDDFGAGYSMLSILADIPIDVVKLDRSLIANCEQNPRSIYLLQQIITLVKGLGYHVLCEGVENEHQISILRKSGCEAAQGYYYYEPLTIEEYEHVMYEAGGGII